MPNNPFTHLKGLIPQELVDALDTVVDEGPAGSMPAASQSLAMTFKPGGTETGPSVFNDFADLSAQLDEARGQLGTNAIVRIYFDDSVVSPVVLPAGHFDMTNVAWVGGTGESVTINVPEGTTFIKLLMFEGNMRCNNLATATSPMLLEDQDTLFLGPGGPFIEQGGTVPFFSGSAMTSGDFSAISTSGVAGMGVYVPSPAGGPLWDLPVSGTQTNLNLREGSYTGAGVFGAAAGVVFTYFLDGANTRFDPDQPDVVSSSYVIGTNTRYNMSTLSASATVNIIKPNYKATTVSRHDTTSGNKVAQLPATTAVTNGDIVIIKNEVGGNNVNVTPDGSDTIDSVAALSALTPGQSAQFLSDGVSNWIRL
jgi:hypothetical protein